MNDPVTQYIASHPAYREGIPTDSALHQARMTALAQFRAAGFPTTRMEQWKYTSTRLLRETPFQHVTTHDETFQLAESLLLANTAHTPWVFVNGRRNPLDSKPGGLPPGVKEVPLPSLGSPSDSHPFLNSSSRPFDNLNLAFCEDGLVLEVQPNTIIEEPLQFIFVGDAREHPAVSHPRVTVSVGHNSQITILQTHLGLGEAPCWLNSVVQFQVGANAQVNHHILHRGGDQLHYVGDVQAHLQRDARYNSTTWWLGGMWTRNDLDVHCEEPGASTTLHGLYLTDHSEHLDNHTLINHQVPRCQSQELYKGALGGKSKAVFNGRVVVQKDAQHTDSSQSNRNLLLSKQATIHTKPELEIYADDVSCAHGTTVGQMEEDELFYLRSRGIGLRDARIMLTRAFCAEILDAIPHPDIRQHVEALVDERLTQMTEGSS